MTRRLDSKTHAACAGAVAIGGANFIAVSLSNRELPPFFGAALRFALAAALFFIMARLWRVPLARGRSAAGAAVYGLLGFGASYALLYYSLVGLAAGTAAIIVAAVPLFTLAIAVLQGQERLTVRGVVAGALVVTSIQFTASVAARDRFRPAQDLLRHQIPDGDPAKNFDRALTVLVEQLVESKVAARRRAAPPLPRNVVPYESRPSGVAPRDPRTVPPRARDPG
ncbi:MAG: EamA family transporter [Armatimonadota bacterium]|nr:EamA family transporter [Armatimonadota bacterium]